MDRDSVTPRKKKSIFNVPEEKVLFEDIYNPLLPEFLLATVDFSTCECWNSTEPCQKVTSIFTAQLLGQAKRLYEKVKSGPQKNPHTVYYIDNPVLQPHIDCLVTIMPQSNAEAIYLILKHAKTEYLTFWVYGRLCASWPSFQQYSQKIKELIRKGNLSLKTAQDQEEYELSQQLKSMYYNKMSGIFRKCYLVFVRLVIRQEKIPDFIEKVAVCTKMWGRKRQEHEIIQAALNM